MEFGDPWSAEQSALADVLMIAWAAHARWPIFQYVSSELGKRGIKDAVEVLNSFPNFGVRSHTSRSYSDIRFDHTYPWPPANSEVSLSVSGLARHHAGYEMAQAFVEVLRYAADKYARTPMDPTKVVQVEVTSEELAARPGFWWPDYLLRAAGAILKTEWPSGVHHMGGPEDATTWALHVGQEVLRYADATVDAYIEGVKRDIDAAAIETSRWYRPVIDVGPETGEVIVAEVQRIL